MIKLQDTVVKVIIFLALLGLMVFCVLLYNFGEQQKAEIDSIRDKLDVEAEFNSGKFKYEQEQILHLAQDLEVVQGQIKTQENVLAETNDELLKESGKRQEFEQHSKDIALSLESIKSKENSLTREMYNWQRDYVSVLSELQKNQNDAKQEIRSLEEGFVQWDLPGLKSKINDLEVKFKQMADTPKEKLQPDYNSDKDYENFSQMNQTP